MRKIKLSKKEIELKKLHDQICESCDGCSKKRCAFTEGYKRGRTEAFAEFMRDSIKNTP